MTTERDARLEATGAWTLAAWGAANSSTKYITYSVVPSLPDWSNAPTRRAHRLSLILKCPNNLSRRDRCTPLILP
jgi:hypothetical protein